jgi:hypothetical protein
MNLIGKSAPLRRWNFFRKSSPSSTAKPTTSDLHRPLACQSFFALIACQRSGTHLLREILNSNSGIALLAEPFTPYPKPVYWQNYVKTLPEHEYPPQTSDDAMLLLDQYLQWIQQDVHENSDWYWGPKPQLITIGLDVKYNQLQCVTPLFFDLRARPLLLDYFQSRNVRIVHMVRNNLVHAAISLIICKLRKVYQNYDGGVMQGQYQIAPGELFECIAWIKDERDEFLRLAQDLPMQTCAYEELIQDLGRADPAGNFPEDTTALSRLATFLDVANRFRYRGYTRKVINKPYAESIENYNELVLAIKQSEYSEFADTL